MLRIPFLLLVTWGLGLFAQEKTIYLAMDDHTDYVWTADEETYRRAFLEMIDYYVDLKDKTINNPVDFQSRFHIGGSYWVWQYERNKKPAEFQRLLSAMRSGHISMALNTLDQTYGAAPMEATLRGFYYAGALERKHGVRFVFAGGRPIMSNIASIRLALTAASRASCT